MNYPLELFIGFRYLRARKRNHFISFISFISIFGIALAIILLITVLSVMNGFQQELRDRILVMTSHVTVSSVHGGLQDWRKIDEALTGDQDIRGRAPFVRGEAMLSHAGNVHAALIRGILPEYEPGVSMVANKIKNTALVDLRPGEFGIILGRELAHYLAAQPGDKITVVSPQLNFSPAGVMPRLKRFTLLGTFEVGMHEFDNGLALVHMEDAARLMRMEGKASGVRLRISRLFDAPQKRYEISQKLGTGYYVDDWTRQHANFFRAVKMEKTVMFVILSLIIAVAAFNIISTLVMVVTDKASDIAILRTLGLSPVSIMQIFMVQGIVIGLLGTFIGMLGGVALATHIESIVQFIEQQLETRFLDPSIYYISELPSQILWSDVTLVCGISFITSTVATLYPALRASKTHPVEALRYE